MGKRVKIEMKKIDDIEKRRVAFSKRHSGLVKKAHELSVLCDTDVGLLVFYPSGKRITCFSGRSRFEDILIKYLNCRDQVPSSSNRIPNKESLTVLLENLKVEEDSIAKLPNQNASPNLESLAAGEDQQLNLQNIDQHNLQNIDQQMIKCHGRLETLKGYLRLLCSEVPSTSTSQIDERTRKIREILNQVTKRKNNILRERSEASSSSMPTTMVHSPQQMMTALHPENAPLYPQESPMQVEELNYLQQPDWSHNVSIDLVDEYFNFDEYYGDQCMETNALCDDY
ncbi:hypothetical protein LUZ61_007035 [Rhynchospora tenuis]|uniref:MADS-box domain-containing protein n=1 Tax=Rhynchospora tenuis TaxID=198213 RepID=A0AAD6EW84_9POAL|nr:hypothetical protein LUZ61_007035 [Rhynchospora tenuis]